ncbi:hypothetical protein [Lentzea jiangxiensis]|uniref:hypothetical protein n=1 Tax=Lentzea jiangxiensis TaxID=641025 RepID=UPI0015A2A9B1|nr:hypothetical protein [Lentzea jiangxiensis]
MGEHTCPCRGVSVEACPRGGWSSRSAWMRGVLWFDEDDVVARAGDEVYARGFALGDG